MNITINDFFQRHAQVVFLTTLVSCLLYSIGLIGNLLMFVVYSRSSLSKLSVSVYFRFIAVFCIFKILFYFIVSRNYEKIIPRWPTLFKLINFFSDIFIPTAVWFETAISFDRFFTILFPYRFKFIRNLRFQLGVVAGVITYNAAFHALVLFTVTRKTVHSWT